MSVNLFVKRERHVKTPFGIYKGARYLLIWDFVDIKIEDFDIVLLRRQTDEQTVVYTSMLGW